MDTCTATKNRIIQLCKQRNLTISQLSALSGVSHACIQRILSHKTKRPHMMTIRRICNSLEITPKDFYDTDDFRYLNQQAKEVLQQQRHMRMRK